VSHVTSSQRGRVAISSLAVEDHSHLLESVGDARGDSAFRYPQYAGDFAMTVTVVVVEDESRARPGPELLEDLDQKAPQAVIEGRQSGLLPDRPEQLVVEPAPAEC